MEIETLFSDILQNILFLVFFIQQNTEDILKNIESQTKDCLYNGSQWELKLFTDILWKIF